MVKINAPTQTVGANSVAKPTRDTAASARGSAAQAAERVDISRHSAQLQDIAGSEAPVDAQKVAEIKQAIAEGRFQINPERIADGLLNSVREVLAGNVSK